MKTKVIILIAFVILLAASAFWLGRLFMTRQVDEKELHYHAGFYVYMDGKLQDYSALQYMHIEPCTKEEHKEVKEDEQEEKAHLHDGVGDVVHVHRKGAVWQDLFTNMHVTLPAGEKVQGYIGGKPVSDILHQPITAYESVVIIVGDTKGIDISRYVTVDHIKATEKRSESCGS